MKNKLLLLVLSLLLISKNGLAYDFEVDGIYYDCNISAMTAYVTYGTTKYETTKYSGDVIIPPSVTIATKTLDVTSIGDSAFLDCTSLTSIDIPNSVTSIGKFAFYGCKSLTSIDIPNSVTSIGKFAFYGCKSLTSINIPNSVTSIGELAFYGCKSLTSVIIPNSVTSIQGQAFSRCSSLTSIDIPNSVTSIGGSAFSGCTSLTSINIPNSVTSIGKYAFDGCTSLTSVIIPNSVTSIGIYAFSGCKSLTSINIPKDVTHLYSVCLLGSSIREIILDDSDNPLSLTITEGALTYKPCPNNLYIGRVVTSGALNVDSLEILTISNNMADKTLPSFTNSKKIKKIYSNIINPQNNQVSFLTTVYVNATLYVPIGTLEKYQTTDGWKQFFTIVEDPSLGNETSDVKQTNADNPTVKISNGQVSVSGMEDKTLVSVFDINGTPLGSTYSSNGNAVICTNLPQNTLVIIKIGNKSFKTIMR